MVTPNRQERTDDMSEQTKEPKLEIGTLVIDADITLRRMVVRHPKPKRTVLLLHGFPETVMVWKDIALALAAESEVHAFDWPGFGASSRPAVDRFGYAPHDLARVLKRYIDRTGIDRSNLIIYGTDIGALPALLLAQEEPSIARSIIVGDFAPFNRPAWMWENLQALKSQPAAAKVRAFMNANRDEILANTFFRGLPVEAHYEIAGEARDDMARGWSRDGMTAVDAFAQYYAGFTRDQDDFEANLARLATPVRVIWGAEDFYIKKEMAAEFAERIKAPLTLLPGIGHYVHLQAPDQVLAAIRAAFR
jgi:pimeloyl-ACP methyl ester carboxylesterase